MHKGLVFCAAGNICPSTGEPTDEAKSYGCDACQFIKSNKVSTCSNFIKMTGKSPMDNESYDQWGCSIAFTPVIMLEVARTNRGKTQALESFRNESVKRQDEAIKLVKDHGTRKITQDR